MKKVVLLMLALFILAIPFSVSAARGPRGDQAGQPPEAQNENWQSPDGRNDNSMPFKWHERRQNFSPEHHRMERVEDRDMNDRFPGEHPYRWHDRRGEGFMYHGHRVTDAVFFYDDSDELISIGFIHDGVFIRIHADNGEERSPDSFFLSWMQHH